MTISMEHSGVGAPTASSNEERLGLYVATASRLERQILSISEGRKWLVWIALAALALALAFAFVHWVAAAFLLLAGVATYLVGHYISAVHIAEDRHALDEARRVIASLRGERR